MLLELTLDGEIDKPAIAIKRLQAFVPTDGAYHLAFSGGKDSIVIFELATRAKVPFEAHYKVTGVDPPELVRFIRRFYPSVHFMRPTQTMWKLIERKMMPPTRTMRYCCEHLKHINAPGSTIITGVRWAESVRRKQNRTVVEINHNSKNRIMLNSDNDEARRLFETCHQRGVNYVNPIVDWSTDEVWQFIRENNLPYCSLYDEGFSRLGCIGCPLSGAKHMAFEFERYPRFRALYLRAFDKMLAARREKGMPIYTWTDAESVMQWWMNDKNTAKTHLLDGQISFFDDATDAYWQDEVEEKL